MAPRAYWKGSLKLSLVTCPIALYPASTQAEKNAFPPDQHQDRPPAEAADGRRADRSGRRQGSQGQGLRTLEGKVCRDRGRRARRREAREHPHHRNRRFRSRRGYRRAISGQAVLHRSQRQGGRRCIRGHSRRHEAKGQGGACARGAFEQGACHRAEAAGQGIAWERPCATPTN